MTRVQFEWQVDFEMYKGKPASNFFQPCEKGVGAHRHGKRHIILIQLRGGRELRHVEKVVEKVLSFATVLR